MVLTGFADLGAADFLFDFGNTDGRLTGGGGKLS
jgi:hypothetical protein